MFVNPLASQRIIQQERRKTKSHRCRITFFLFFFFFFSFISLSLSLSSWVVCARVPFSSVDDDTSETVPGKKTLGHALARFCFALPRSLSLCCCCCTAFAFQLLYTEMYRLYSVLQNESPFLKAHIYTDSHASAAAIHETTYTVNIRWLLCRK